MMEANDDPPLVPLLPRGRGGRLPHSEILSLYVPAFPLFGVGAGDSDYAVQLLRPRQDRRQRERAATNRFRVGNGDRDNAGLSEGP
jgi:hypothetical protein